MIARCVIEHVKARRGCAGADLFHRLQRILKLTRIFLSAFAFLSACACSADTAPEQSYADEFMARLAALCGKAYAGRLVSTDDADADFASQEMVMHVRRCEDDVIRIPFHVGDDRSRTWVISRTDGGLRLKHDHRHEDGEADEITQYGGDAATLDSATRVEFPVDGYSIEMFRREGLTASVTNVWAIELTDEIFAYELNRENRHFRVEFDVTKPVSAPPAPWGAKS